MRASDVSAPIAVEMYGEWRIRGVICRVAHNLAAEGAVKTASSRHDQNVLSECSERLLERLSSSREYIKHQTMSLSGSKRVKPLLLSHCNEYFEVSARRVGPDTIGFLPHLQLHGIILAAKIPFNFTSFCDCSGVSGCLQKEKARSQTLSREFAGGNSGHYAV